MSYCKFKKTALQYLKLNSKIIFFSNLVKKFYCIKEIKDVMEAKFCGITVFRFKKPLILEYYKKKYVLQCKKNIETIVLGSSHGNRGLNSSYMSMPTCNLATTSQDLFQSYHMFKYALKNSKTIRNVVLFFSPFSSGFNISKSSEKYRTAFMKTVFEIEPYIKDLSISKRFYKKPCWFFFYDFSICSDNNPLFGIKNFLEEDVKQRVLKHNDFAKNTEMNEYLIKIIELAKEKNINLYIVIPPYTNTYKKFVNKNVFDSVKKISNEKEISLFSFYEDSDFNDNDFSDSDHLNIDGAIKLTRKINILLEEHK